MQRPSRLARSVRQCLDALRQRFGCRRPASPRPQFRPVLEGLERIEAPNVLANPVADAQLAALLGEPAADSGGEPAFSPALIRALNSAADSERTWLSPELPTPLLTYSVLTAPTAQAGDLFPSPVLDAAPAAYTSSSPVEDLSAAEATLWSVSWGFPELALGGGGGAATAAGQGAARSSLGTGGNPPAEAPSVGASSSFPPGSGIGATPPPARSQPGSDLTGQDPFSWVLDSSGNGPKAAGRAAPPKPPAKGPGGRLGPLIDSTLNVTVVSQPVISEGGSAGPNSSGQIGFMTDPTCPYGGSPDHYTATVYWGDGTSSNATVSPGGMYFGVTVGAHQYQEESPLGGFLITLTVQDTTDGDSGSASTGLTVTDASLSQVSGGGSLTESVGVPFTAALATFADADPFGTASDYSATITWGDGTTSSGSFAPAGGNFILSGTHTYQAQGVFHASATVHDAGGSAVQISTVTVTVGGGVGGSGSRLYAGPLPLDQVEGVAGSNLQVAVFTDSDGNTDPSQYTATITWGDGTPVDAGVVVPRTGGGFQVQGSHVYQSTAGSPFTVTVTLTDGNPALQGFKTTFTTTATVTAFNGVAVNNLSPVEGQSYSGPVATYTPPSGGSGSYAAEIGWGDGAVTAGTVTPAGGGTYTVSGTHTYADETPSGRPYPLTVTVRDPLSSTVLPLDGTGTVTVADGALTAGSVPALAGWAGTTTGQVLVGHFTDANPPPRPQTSRPRSAGATARPRRGARWSPTPAAASTCTPPTPTPRPTATPSARPSLTTAARPPR